MTGFLRIASAGSSHFGVRAAASLPACAAAGFAPDAFDIFTDHGHELFEAAKAGTLAADIVLLPADMIDDLQDAGLAHTRGRVDLGRVCIGACVGEGREPFDVSTSASLAAALRDADEIVLTLAPSGEHMMSVIATLGLMDAVERKIRRFDKSAQVNAYVAASGNRALAFGPATEILAFRERGLRWCGPVPEAFQVALPYAAAALVSAQDGAAAQAFLQFLSGDAARRCFADSGVAI